jgi:hypothetical protein
MPYKKSLLFQNKKIDLEIEPYFFAPHTQPPQKNQTSKKTYRLRIKSDKPLSEKEQKFLNEYLKSEGYIEEAFANFTEKGK